MKKVELLSPVGSEKALKAAVNSGADSIYMGTTSHNARMGAENFNEQNIENAIKYAKLRDVKAYITLNTLLYNNEINKIISLVKNLHDMGADAVIVQDLGIVNIIRNNLKINMHASTQMSCHNLDSVKLLKRLGVSRVVMAREMNIEDISNIAKNIDMELEVFVHGALCSSFSGQCLYSFIKGGRSANRGRCAQPCRMPYTGGETFYPLSTKDLMTIEILPSLIKNGVSALKIEGRVKRGEYVEVTTRIYRSAIDLALENKDIPLEKYREELIKIYNRGGFTQGYYCKEKNIFSNVKPNHLGEYIGKVVGHKKNKIYIKSEKTLNVYDGLSLGDAGMEISDLYKNGERVKSGNGNLNFSSVLNGIKIGDSVYRTTDKLQIEGALKIIESDSFKHRLKAVCDIDDKITIRVENEKLKAYYVSDHKVEEAKTSETTKDSIISAISKTGGTVFIFEDIRVNIKGHPFIPIKVLNELRREVISILEKELLKSEKKEYDKNIFKNIFYQFNKKEEYENTNIKIAVVDDIKTDTKNYNYKILSPKVYDDNIIRYYRSKKIDGIILPHITFDDDIEVLKNIADKDMIVICNNLGQIEAFREVARIWAGIGLNALNDKAVDFLYSLGCSLVISSIETREKLNHTVKIRNGKIPVMNFTLCPKSISVGCDKCKEKDIIDKTSKVVEFDCVKVKNKISFILENIENKYGEIDILRKVNIE